MQAALEMQAATTSRTRKKGILIGKWAILFKLTWQARGSGASNCRQMTRMTAVAGLMSCAACLVCVEVEVSSAGSRRMRSVCVHTRCLGGRLALHFRPPSADLRTFRPSLPALSGLGVVRRLWKYSICPPYFFQQRFARRLEWSRRLVLD